MNDVDVVDRDSLDDEHRPLHHKPWLVQFVDSRILYFDTEEDACTFQRRWRCENGMNPMTGELT